MTAYPDPRTMGSLVELLDELAVRYQDRPLLSLRTDAGIELAWSGTEIRHRARLAAWRLREMGLQPGDRLLTWSPSTPRLPAVYWGAMMARLIIVPLDLRMAPEVLRRVADRAETQWMALGTGLDAPDPEAVGLGGLTVRTLDELTADAGPGFPPDWEARLDAWPRPGRDDPWEVIYTSGSTGHPKGVVLTHGTTLATLEAVSGVLPPRHHRLISVLPLSHLFEQAPVLLYGTMVGAEVRYVRSRNPRVIFESLRELQVTTMVLAPQLLELFWNAIMREVALQGREAAFGRLRRIARRLPYRARRLLFAKVHRQLGGRLTLLASAGAYLPPELQTAWEDLGIAVVQGYGATECGAVACTSERDHPTGSIGRPLPPLRLRLATLDQEILVAGSTVMPGYWRDPEATAQAIDDEGWYHTGDIGRFDERGHLRLVGRKKNIIVLPNGFNVFPEDIENLLEDEGIGESVVVETSPGRIEAVVLPPGSLPIVSPATPVPERPADARGMDGLHEDIDARVRRANARMAQHGRLDAWRLWPEPDFPRTHTLKIRRDLVRAWAAADTPLAILEEVAT